MIYGQKADGSGMAPIPVSSDGQTIPVSGTLTATVDESTLATSAKQDTGNTTLAEIATDTDNLASILADLVLLLQPTKLTAVTKSDSTDTTATATKGIWVGGAGDLAVKGAGDSVAVTLVAVPAGTYIPGAYQRIMATNTTATNIVSFAGP